MEMTINGDFTRYEGGEMGAALGAARLAKGGTFAKPEVAKTVEPDAQLSPAYAAAHTRFRALYPALKDIQ